MKTVKPVVLLTSGFIVAVLIAGCFSPVDITDHKGLEGQQSTWNEDGSYDVNIAYYAKGARTAVPTGPTAVEIQSGLYNYVQLVVVSENGSVLSFQDNRKKKSDDKGISFEVNDLPVGNVGFLLLLGYWERDFDAEKADNGVITYAYNKDATPVLLASGYAPKEVKADMGGIVTITLWPLVTYATFTNDPAGSSPEEFESGAALKLLPGVPWKVKWEIVKKQNMSNGLESLIAAQNLIVNPDVSDLRIVEKASIEAVSADPASIKRKVITGTTSSNTIEVAGWDNDVSHIGKPHAVNYNLAYTPFSLTSGSTPWANYTSSVTGNKLKGPPQWILRNGLNDLPKDAYTDYNPTALGAKDSNNNRKNGNGSVVATVIAVSGYPTGGDGKEPITPGADPSDKDKPEDPLDDDPTKLLIYDGRYFGQDPSDPSKAAITFKTWGYKDEEHIFYALVKNDKGYNAANPLPYDQFTTSFSTPRPAGGPYVETLEINDSDWYTNDKWQLWLIFAHKGKVSNRLLIELTKSNLDKNWQIFWQWGTW